MHRRPHPPRRRLLARPPAWLLALPLAAACIHTWETREGPSDEQLLDLYTTTATYLYEDDSLVRAQDQAVKALEIDPQNRAMRRMIAWIRLRMGSNQDLIIAEQFFRQLRREGDQNEGTVLGLATTLERLGTAYDQAARRDAPEEPGEAVEAVASRTPEERRQLTERALAYWNEALELYLGTVETGEGSTNAMNGLQRVCALLGQYDQSLVWSQRLLERSSEEMEVWRRLLTQADLSERDEKLFRENERIATALQADTHVFVATLMHRLDRDADAIAHLDAVAELRPELAEVYGRRAQLLGALGEYERAIADIDRYLRLSDEPYEHPDVRRAFELKAKYQKALEARARETASTR